MSFLTDLIKYRAPAIAAGAYVGVGNGTKSIGSRCLLLGDSMMHAHNQLLSGTGMTLTRTNNVTTVTYSGTQLISKQLITVNGFDSSYGFNANRVEVTWISSASFSYPNPGPDIASTAGTVSHNPLPVLVFDRADNRGWVSWANSKLNGGLSIVSNAGVGADTFARMRARLATDVDPFDFDILFLHGGYNDLSNLGSPVAGAAATAWADCKYIIDKYTALGKTVVLTTVLPVGSANALYGSSGTASAGQKTTFQSELLELRRLQLAYVVPGLVLIDGYLDAIDPSSASGYTLANMTGDGIHPTAKLARLMGTRVYNALVNRQVFPDLRAVSAADTYANRPTSTQLLDSGWAGTGGTTGGAGLTYTSVPSGMKADYGGTQPTSGTVTGATRADGFGYDLNYASFVASGACTPRNGSVTIPSGSYAVGDIITTVCEVTISGDPGNIKGIYGALQQVVTTEGNGFAYANASSDTAANHGVADGTYVLVTPPMKITTGITNLVYNAIVDVGAAGTITNIKFGRIAVYKNLQNSGR